MTENDKPTASAWKRLRWRDRPVVLPARRSPHGSAAYLLSNADQWKSGVRDIPAALEVHGLKNKATALMDVYQHHRIGRGLARYSLQNGRASAGGISYMALFSISALVTVGWSLFSHFFSADTAFQSLVITSVNRYIPGLIADPTTGSSGLVNPEDLDSTPSTVAAGIIAFAVAAWTSVQIIRYFVDGIRSMFGLIDYPGTMVSAYLRYFAGVALLFAAVLATAVLSVASAWFEDWIRSLAPATHSVVDSAAFEVVRLGIPSLIDFLMFMVLVRYVSRVRVPYKTVLVGGILYAVVATVLRYGGGAVIGASKDPVIATIATAATLLLWVNFLARATLMISAWMADPPAVVPKVRKQTIHARQIPNYVTLFAPATLEWPHNPLTGDIIPGVPLQEAGAEVVSEVEGQLLAQAEKDPSASDPATSTEATHTSKVTTTGA